MNATRRLHAGAAIAIATAALWVGAAPGSPACADEGPRAVLVVDGGSEGAVHRFCVALPDDEVSGIELSELAGEQHGLEYRFGYGGNAVCMLAGVGTDGDDCFAEYPDFWGYWRGDGSGGWDWSGSGAGSTLVEDGDVEGWSWGRGDSGSTHPAPPSTSFPSVCPISSEPRSRNNGGGRSRSSSTSPAGDPSGPASDGASTRAEREGDAPNARSPRRRPGVRDDDRRRAERGEADAIGYSKTGADGGPAAGGATSSPTSTQVPEGPPVAGLIALAGTVALAVAGVLIRRRRTP